MAKTQKDKKVQVVSYALYQDVFRISNEDIEAMIDNKIKGFDPVESICFSSFLNMVCQTTPFDELRCSQLMGSAALVPREYLIKPFSDGSLLYHRENLLQYILRIINKDIDGNLHITGDNKGYDESTTRYCQILLLINNKLNSIAEDSKFSLERQLLRDYPPKFRNMIWQVYKSRILRYKYIFSNIPKEYEKDWSNVLNKFEEKTGVSFIKYLQVVKTLFIWFAVPVEELHLEIPHFDKTQINTFYINKANFKKDTDFITVLDNLSLDLTGFKGEVKKKRKDKLDNDYKGLQTIYDYPVYKINNNEYCIVDLAFLIEKITLGLFWVLKEYQTEDLQTFSGKYGLLLESYFKFLVRSIFQDKIICEEGKDAPDGLLTISHDRKEYIVIFEFTIKGFRISSLFNSSMCNFEEDLYNKLFDPTQQDSQVKFKQLNKFVEQKAKEKPNAEIIPVIVTEGYLGDYELLDRNEGFLSKQIEKLKLTYLKNNRPTFISLDDLENFWACSLPEKAGKMFLTDLQQWKESQKGEQLFSFSSFISDGRKIVNDEYLKIFDTKNLAKKNET